MSERSPLEASKSSRSSSPASLQELLVSILHFRPKEYSHPILQSSSPPSFRDSLSPFPTSPPPFATSEQRPPVGTSPASSCPPPRLSTSPSPLPSPSPASPSPRPRVESSPVLRSRRCQERTEGPDPSMTIAWRRRVWVEEEEEEVRRREG